MRPIIALLLCVLSCSNASRAQNDRGKLPAPARLMLDREFPGWTFVYVGPEVRNFFKEQAKDESPVVVSGDFDGNGRRDYSALIRRSSRCYLVSFLRRTNDYKLYVIKDPDGEYLSVAKKGSRDYNYDEQKEITYASDTILTGIYEKGGSSYVYKEGRFTSFVSSD